MVLYPCNILFWVKCYYFTIFKQVTLNAILHYFIHIANIYLYLQKIFII